MIIEFIANGETFDLPIDPHRDGNYSCPMCANGRKKKGLKTLRWYKLDPGKKERGGTGFCHHCRSWCHMQLSPEEKQAYARKHNLNSDTTFIPKRPKVQLQMPVVPDTADTKTLTPEKCDELLKKAFPLATRHLSNKAATWLSGRGIDREVAAQLGVFSTVRHDKEVLAFVYQYNGYDCNIKFRDLERKAYSFFLSNAPKILYNAEALTETDVLIVTEGEMDTLSYAQAGIFNTAAVPTGAAGKQDGWVKTHAGELDKIKRFYLAADDDECGNKLRDTLLHLWGACRCEVVTYNGLKDANDLLQAEGINAIYAGLEQSARIEPRSNLHTDMRRRYDELMKLFYGGGMKGEKLGFAPIDDFVSWRTGALALITGIPGHGKSGFLDFLIMRLNRQLGWKAVMYSPENNPDVHHFGKLISIMTDKRFSSESMSVEMCDAAFDELCDACSFIDPNLSKLSDILAAIEWQVKHRGVKVAAIDPYNVLDIEAPQGTLETEVINRVLDHLHRFARRLNILLFLIAHPRKMEQVVSRSIKVTAQIPVYRIPALYDVMGSSHFYNHIDYGIIVYRDFSAVSSSDQSTMVIFEKIKWSEMGSPGFCSLNFNMETNRYEDPKGDSTASDQEDTSWLRLS